MTARYNSPGSLILSATLLLFALSFSLFTPGVSVAQGIWHHSVLGTSNSGNIPTTAVVDSAGNIIVSGNMTRGSVSGLDTVKYDKDGNELWAHLINFDSGVDGIEALDSAQDIVIIVNSLAPPILIKYSPSGVRLRATSVQVPQGTVNSAALGILIDTSNNVYIYGYIVRNNSLHNSYSSLWLEKYDSSGDSLWQRVYPGSVVGFSQATEGALDSNGNVVLTGIIDNGTTSQLIVTKYDPSGNQVYVSGLSSKAFTLSQGGGLVLDKNDNIYVAGIVKLNSGDNGVLAAKFSSAGQQLWAHYRLGISGSQIANFQSQHIVLDGSGDVVTDTSTSDSKNNSLRTLVKYDSDGNIIWAKRNGKTDSDFYEDTPAALFADSSDNLYAVDSVGLLSLSLVTSSLVTATKFDPEGEAVWEQDYTGSPNNPYQAQASGAAFDPATSSLYVIGYATFDATGWLSEPDSDWFTIKYQP